MFVLAACAYMQLPCVRAATSTWSGASSDNFWTTAANWTNNAAPSAGDDLVFPLGVGRLSAYNDFPAKTAFNSISLAGAGYSLDGSMVALSAGITVAAGVANNNVLLPLTLTADQAITVSNANFSSALFLRGSIDLGSNTLTFAGPGYFQVQSLISGAGSLRKAGSGGALLYAANTFTGRVDVVGGTLSIYNPAVLGTTNGVTFVETNATLTLGSSTPPYVVNEPLILAGTLGPVSVGATWAGPITLANAHAAVNVNSPSAPLTVGGLVSGNGGLDKNGAGLLVLNANNTYAGTTTVNNGTLQVNGSQPVSPVLLTGGTLGGTGVVGTVTVSGSFAKTIAPGASVGVLTCGNVTLSSNTTFAVELNGPAPGSGYSQLNVNGTIALSNALLNILPGFEPPVGTAFIIINNDGSDPVFGTFAGQPEGAILNGNGIPFQISYVGGDGNDVVLTRVSPPSGVASIANVGNGQVQLQATGGLSGFTYTIQAATNLTPVVLWSNIGSAVADSGGIFSFTDTNAPLFPTRFYRVLSP